MRNVTVLSQVAWITCPCHYIIGIMCRVRWVTDYKSSSSFKLGPHQVPPKPSVYTLPVKSGFSCLPYIESCHYFHTLTYRKDVVNTKLPTLGKMFLLYNILYIFKYTD